MPNYSAAADLRMRNPFRDALVTELLEDVDLYRDMFSENILVGQAGSVFLPVNVVVLGPQGCGKSMILNLTRLRVLAGLSIKKETWPKILSDDVPPFFGISINFARVSFFAFGKRSISESMNRKHDPILDTAAAADFLSHYLFAEFVKSIDMLKEKEYVNLRRWLGIADTELESKVIPREVATWSCWKKYYSKCKTWEDLYSASMQRLETWRKYLNTDIDQIPRSIWKTKAQPDQVLHSIGNLVRKISTRRKNASLFVYIDQYEVLKELNATHGTELQRLINSLIKSRDPVVFYKVGARTYDWGQELRVPGAESRIEVQRDYTLVNLSDILMRTEDRAGYIYQNFALDVACRRLKTLHNIDFMQNNFKSAFGKWDPYEESRLYFKRKASYTTTIKEVTPRLKNKIIKICGKNATPLDYRLASAWVLQKIQRKQGESAISREVEAEPWHHKWWFKERKEIGLVQIASHANQKRRYYGWDMLCYLSGGNITLFLLLCSEIWDVAARQGVHPFMGKSPVDPRIQTEGILKASAKCREADRNEVAGSHRYSVINRIGASISNSILGDLALSNPGHTGFSLSEDELYREDSVSKKVRRFLENAVSWTIIEERRHKSKNEKDSPRRKYYLHPILSPYFEIPVKRVKEPYYTKIEKVYAWIYSSDKVDFGKG